MEVYGTLIENAIQFGCTNARMRKVCGLGPGAAMAMAMAMASSVHGLASALGVHLTACHAPRLFFRFRADAGTCTKFDPQLLILPLATELYLTI